MSTVAAVPPGGGRGAVSIPNLLSALRILLVPVFLVLLAMQDDLAALIALVVASVSDFLDGYLARRLGLVSHLGQLLDQAADVLAIVGVGIGLTARGILPLWILLVIGARELWMVGIAVALARHSLPSLKSNRTGKIATFVLLAALPVLLGASALPWAALALRPTGLAAAVAAAALYWAAGLLYARSTVRGIRDGRDDTPRASVSLGDRRRSTDGRRS